MSGDECGREQEERMCLLSGHHEWRLVIFHDSLFSPSVFVFYLWLSAVKGQDLHHSVCLSVCYNMRKRETALRGRRESRMRAVMACVGLASLSLISVWRLIRWHCLRCISTRMRNSRYYQHATKEFCDTPRARNVITHRKRKTISCLKVLLLFYVLILQRFRFQQGQTVTSSAAHSFILSERCSPAAHIHPERWHLKNHIHTHKHTHICFIL